MKRIFFLSIFFFFVGCSSSMLSLSPNREDEMRGLYVALDEYTDATMNHQVDKLMTFVYPKVFSLISEDKMVSLLNRLYSSGKAPKIIGIEHKYISDIQVYEGGVYSLIISDMYMELVSPATNSPEHELFYYMLLKKRMGSNSTVNFDRKRHLYRVKKESKIIAIKEKNQGWKFVGCEQAKKYASRDIIPKQIAMLLSSI